MAHAAAALPSVEAESCREAFAALTILAVELAVRTTNLKRLIAEYVRTERRARALENVLLPDIERSLQVMAEQLEAVDIGDLFHRLAHAQLIQSVARPRPASETQPVLRLVRQLEFLDCRRYGIRFFY